VKDLSQNSTPSKLVGSEGSQQHSIPPMAFRTSIEKGDIEVVEQVSSHLESASRVVEIGEYRVLGLSNEDADFFQNFPEKKRKHVFHKVSILRPSHSRRHQLTCYQG